MKHPLDLIRVVIVCIMLGASRLLAQTSPAENSNPLLALMTALSAHTKTPGEALDPMSDPVVRDQSLKRFSNPHFELTLVPSDSTRIPDGDVASVPIRVHFKTENSELEASATAQFVKRGSTWYFANYDFLALPVFLIAVIIICCCVGVSYAATVPVLRRRLVKRGPIDANNHIPTFHSSLLAYSVPPDGCIARRWGSVRQAKGRHSSESPPTRQLARLLR